MECLGTLLRVVGDRPMGAYLENVDKPKMAKVCTMMMNYGMHLFLDLVKVSARNYQCSLVVTRYNNNALQIGSGKNIASNIYNPQL